MCRGYAVFPISFPAANPGTRPRHRGAVRPSFAKPFAPQERAQGRPGARCTRGLVCRLHIRKRTRAYRFSGGSPAFPAQWFYGLFRALPGDRLSCHRRPRETLAPRKLDASIGASGPHDFAVRSLAVRPRAKSTRRHGQRPPHPIPRPWRSRYAPLWVRRRVKRTDLGRESSDFRKIRKSSHPAPNVRDDHDTHGTEKIGR
jgi:hypothetical protein